jgi:type II secretory pathway predicted ATPase ExeA
VAKHLQYSGANHQIFSDGALDEIHRFSGGAARLINKVCIHSLHLWFPKWTLNY